MRRVGENGIKNESKIGILCAKTRKQKNALPHMSGKHDHAPSWHGSCERFFLGWHNRATCWRDCANLPMRRNVGFSLYVGFLSMLMDPKHLNLINWSVIGLLRVIKHRFILGLNGFWKMKKRRRTLQFLRTSWSLWSELVMIN